MLTWLELNFNSCITLDLFDHFPISSNYHTHRVTGHRYLWNLEVIGNKMLNILGMHIIATVPKCFIHTLMPLPPPPPILDPYSFRSPNPAWSLSLRISFTISFACWRRKKNSSYVKCFPRVDKKILGWENSFQTVPALCRGLQWCAMVYQYWVAVIHLG